MPTVLAILAALPALTAAHGHIGGVVAGGQWYQGWNPALQYQSPIPETVGWQADNLDNGFVSPDSFSDPAIVCHKQGKSNGAYVEAMPGDTVEFQWNTWPESHKGPVMDYIAPCNGDCGAVDKTSLMFTKIDEDALESGSNPGTWATDDLIANNFTWTTTIPSSLAPGNYVIRHEIIALHSAGQSNGAQAYPQCVNFKIGGSGSTELSGGVPATEFYTASDPGIMFSLYTSFDSYPIPGPAVQQLARRHSRDFA